MTNDSTVRRRPGGRNVAPIDATARPTSRIAPRIESIGHAVITVTPAMAAKYLEGKLPNRTIKNDQIDRQVRDIKAGAWHLNGEPFIFSGDEQSVRRGLPEAGLLDGQQRSWSIVEANIPVTTLVVWGVPPESMESIDTGSKRTFGDLLTIRGNNNSTLIAATARWWYWYDTAINTNKAGSASIRPTHHELTETIENHPSITKAATIIASNKKARLLLTPGIGAFVVSGAMEHGWDEEAERFVHVVGAGMDDRGEWGLSHPLYHLYQKLQANRANESKMPTTVVAAYEIKAFNAFAFNRPMRALKWQHLSDKPEPFPQFEKRPKNERQK
jgi:hypothetical protein